jgi:hypothetical protein
LPKHQLPLKDEWHCRVLIFSEAGYHRSYHARSFGKNAQTEEHSHQKESSRKTRQQRGQMCRHPAQVAAGLEAGTHHQKCGQRDDGEQRVRLIRQPRE